MINFVDYNDYTPPQELTPQLSLDLVDIVSKPETTPSSYRARQQEQTNWWDKPYVSQSSPVQISVPSQDVQIASSFTDKLVNFNGKKQSINNAIDIIHMNLNKQSKHTCTRAVANALKGETDYHKSSGVADPSKMYDQLRGSGWKDVLDENYTPQKGDVYTMWGGGGKYGMHTSIYDGEKWLSYGVDNPKEGGKTPWFWNKRGQAGVSMHIMRGRLGGKFQSGGILNKFLPGIDTENSLADMFVTYNNTTPSTYRKNFEYKTNLVTIEDKPDFSSNNESSEQVSSNPFANLGVYHNSPVAVIATPRATLRATKKATDSTPITNNHQGINVGGTTRRKGSYEDSEQGRKQFVKDLNQAYLKAGVTNERLRKALVAQSALESGWGARSLGGGDYNYGNITLGSAKDRNYRIAWDHNAKGENVQQKFRNYDSVDDFIQDKMNLLSKRYKVDFSKDNESSYFDKIIKGGYAEDPYYRTRLNDMYKSVLGRWS